MIKIPPLGALGRDFKVLGRLANAINAWDDGTLRTRIFKTSVIVLLGSIFAAFVPVVFKYAVDEFDQYLEANDNGISTILMSYIICIWLSKLFLEFRYIPYGAAEQKTQRALALKVFDHLHSLPLSFHLERKTGEIINVSLNGLQGLRQILFSVTFYAFPFTIEFILMSVIFLYLFNVYFFGIIILLVVLYIAIFMWGAEWLAPYQRTAVASYVEANGRSTDSYINFETLQYLDGVQYIRRNYDEALQRGESHWISFYIRRAVLGTLLVSAIISGMAALLFYVAATSGDQERYSVGDFVLVNAYILQILRPLEALSLAYRELKQGLIHAERLLDLLQERPAVADLPAAQPIVWKSGRVDFHDVSFSYGGREILKNLSFSIPAGETVAIIGASGSGKSTIVRLLYGFYTPSSGRIEIDGQNINDVTQKSLRKGIGIVPQDSVLFNDSIEMNLKFARPECPFEELHAAACLSKIDTLIESLPEKYHTVVGERGLKLSGGERQRVAIARAVLKQPYIYIFDEATSALDGPTEREIQQNIEMVAHETATLIISHRLSTIVRAREILVIEEGRIRERGQHHELIALNGTYAKMWLEQHREIGSCAESMTK